MEEPVGSLVKVARAVGEGFQRRLLRRVCDPRRQRPPAISRRDHWNAFSEPRFNNGIRVYIRLFDYVREFKKKN